MFHECHVQGPGPALRFGGHRRPIIRSDRRDNRRLNCLVLRSHGSGQRQQRCRVSYSWSISDKMTGSVSASISSS